ALTPPPAPPRRPPLTGRPRPIRDRRRPTSPITLRDGEGAASRPARPPRPASRAHRPEETGRERRLVALFSAGFARVAAAVFIAAVILGLLLLLRGVPPRAAGRPTVAPTPTVGVPTATAAPPVTPAAQQTAPGWRQAGTMQTARYGHTATTLPGGRVLVAGGRTGQAGQPTASAEIYDPATNRWAPTTPMAAPRVHHAAVPLPDGQVLVVGGLDLSREPPAAQNDPGAERYDPATGHWAPTGAMPFRLGGTWATMLTDGRVLALGYPPTPSYPGGPPTAEIYDPATDRWSLVDHPTTQSAAALVPLPSGEALLLGTTSSGDGLRATAEHFDPASGQWRPAAPPLTPRRGIAAAPLSGGKILVVGGNTYSKNADGTTGGTASSAVEIYDAGTDTWTAAAPLMTPRTRAVAVGLGGQVLVIGGQNGATTLTTAELYDIATNSWAPAGALTAARQDFTATPLPFGAVLVAGGHLASDGQNPVFDTAEIYTPGSAPPATPQPAPPSPSPATPTPAATYRPMLIARDRTIAASFLWVGMGQHPGYTPQLAPDGRRVAFFTIGPGGVGDRHIVVHDVASGADRDITPAPGYLYSSLRWSPDGRALALVRTKPGRDGSGPSTSELLVMDADGANARAIYRRDDPDRLGPDLAITDWSADGREIDVGGTMFGGGFNSALVAVRADGSGARELPPRPTPDRARCGLGAGPPEDFHGYLEAPDRSYTVCMVKTSALARPPANAPAGGSSLVRYDAATKRATVVLSVAGGLTPGSISPDGEWLLIGVAHQNPNPTDYGGGQTVRWAVMRRDGTALRDLGGDPFFFVQQGSFTWGPDGRAYFMAWPTVADNHLTGYLYELDAATATVRIVTKDWQMSRLLTVSRDGRQILLVRGPAGRPELHLLDLAPAASATPVPTPAPTLAPDQAVVPPEATATARAFMDARMARDEGRARSYLTPELAARLGTADLIPPADQQWSQAFVVWQERGADGRVTIDVQIPSPKGEFEQTLTLTQRDGRWLIADLGPVENLMPGG
ncbi:MAG TPA: kelch repeat-containing protein, partial [Thermomicrobiales bacterium]|nr:kelch repeat-containing protein [Thermomicrobiales bacterium]